MAEAINHRIINDQELSYRHPQIEMLMSSADDVSQMAIINTEVLLLNYLVFVYVCLETLNN